MANKLPTRKSDLYNKLLIKVMSQIVFLGYVIVYPFEQTNKWLKKSLPDIMILLLSVLDYIKTLLKKRKKAKKRATKKIVQKSKLGFGRNFLIGVAFTILFVMIPMNIYSWYKKLPQPDLLGQRANNKSTKILDRKGRLLYEIYVDKKYDPVALDKVPDDVIQATLAIEDASFYEHGGFNLLSMVRAAKATIFDDELQGGSTITQQLVKNVLLTPERTVSRKVKELTLAVLVEKDYTKNEILELYLNNIPYGGTAYGVQTASQKYFGKNVWDLDLSEASMLAGLPSAPSAYSPVFGNEEIAKSRQKQVLERMMELGYITEEELDNAYEKELTFVSQTEYIRAPHFVEYVRKELYESYGQRAVDFGGLTVTTTINLDLQDEVQRIVVEEVEKNNNINISNGAAIVLDSRTGGILAYVGSVDYFSEDDGKFDVITAYRQPGSSIKPVTYALALEKGLTAANVINDSPITYQSYGQTYSPKNYDGKFHGIVTLRQALANSYNVPAVKLVKRVGIDDMVRLGINMGINNWSVGDGSYGLSVTLGGKEVRLLDLTNVFATFARSGIYRDATPFVSIKDVYGFEIYKLNGVTRKQVVSENTSYIISNILSDNIARSPAFGSNSKLVIANHSVAVKTGTTNDIRDNFTIGYTPSYTTGVWVGNNDNTPMSRVASGISGAAPIWNRIMTYILEGTPNEPFIVPEGIMVKTDNTCGRTEVFDENSRIPGRLCPEEEKGDDSNNKDKEEKRN